MGNFQKQKLVEGVLGSKKFTSKTPIFFEIFTSQILIGAVRPLGAEIWPMAPLCTVGNFQTKIMPQSKNFLIRPPFIFRNMTVEKEISALHQPEREIWPLHSGEFSKAKTSRRSARIEKVYFTDPHFFFEIITSQK